MAPFMPAEPDPSRMRPGGLMVPATPVGAKLLANRARQRRQWVFRSTAMLAGIAILLSFLVTWRRDEMAADESLRLLAAPVAQLQAHLDAWGHLPAEIPEPARGSVELLLSAADRYYADQTSDMVLIGHTPPVMLHLKENGRGVILYQQGKVRAEWMTTAEFRDRSARQMARMRAFEQERRARPPELP